MAQSKKPRKNKRTTMLKGIKIVEADGDFKLYKIWAGNKIPKDPFVITGDIGDLVEAYKDACEKYKLKPDEKAIYKLVKSHQQNEGTHEEPNFLKGYNR